MNNPRRRNTIATRLPIAGLAAALTFGVSACGGDSSSGASGSANESNNPLLAEIESSKKVTIGTSNDAPWSAVEDGEATGIIPDLLREYFKRKDMADVEVVSTPMPFDSLIPSVNAGRIQVMGDAMYRTPEREKQVAFTDVLFYNTEGLAVEKGNPLNISKVADLCGHTGATYKGTVWVDDLNKASSECPDGKKINVKVYATIFQAFQDIQTGRVQGVLADSSIAALAIKENSDLKMELAEDYVSPSKADSDNALAVSKDNVAFVNDFSTVYKDMMSDGTVEKIFNEHGLEPAAPWLAE